MSDKKPVKAGGAKGEAIVALIREDPSLTRSQLAEKAGATVGRVGEVVRHLRDRGTAEEKKVVARHLTAQFKKTAAQKAAPAPAKRAGRARKAAAE